jgi:hypothetical protein
MAGKRNQKAFREAGQCRNMDMVRSRPSLGSDKPVQENDFSRPEKGRLDYQGQSNQGGKSNLDRMTMEKQDAVQM